MTATVRLRERISSLWFKFTMAPAFAMACSTSRSENVEAGFAGVSSMKRVRLSFPGEFPERVCIAALQILDESIDGLL